MQFPLKCVKCIGNFHTPTKNQFRVQFTVSKVLRICATEKDIPKMRDEDDRDDGRRWRL